jgi:hypothetical protein
VVRAARELDAKSSPWLAELHPDHCQVGRIHVYTVGFPCEKIREAAQRG